MNVRPISTLSSLPARLADLRIKLRAQLVVMLVLSGITWTLMLTGCAQEYDASALETKLTTLESELAAAEDARRAQDKQIDDLRAELNALKRQGDSSAEALASVKDRSTALQDQLAAAQTSIDAMQKATEDLELSSEEATKLASRIEAVRNEVVKLKEDVQGVSEKADMAARNAGNSEKQKGFNTVAEQLELDEEQREVFKESLTDAKQRLVEVLQVPTASGRVFLDDIFDAFIDAQGGGDPTERFTEIFTAMAEAQYPGDSLSYAELIGEANEQFKADLRDSLRPDQYAKFEEQWGDNPTEIELPEQDPVITRIIERMGWRNQAKEADNNIAKLAKQIVAYHRSRGAMPGNPADLVNASMLGPRELDGDAYNDYSWQGDVQDGRFVGSIYAQPRAGAFAPEVEYEVEASGSATLYYDGKAMTHKP